MSETVYHETAVRPARSTRKKDQAPRGVFRHRSGVWAARFTCGAGHIHQERVGPLKSDAIRVYHDRRARAHNEPGWCSAIERRDARARVRLEADRERRLVTFREYAQTYLEYAKIHKRSWRSDVGRLALCSRSFGDRRLDEITSLELEQFRDSLLDIRSRATVNRYRDLLSAVFKRAARDGLVAVNPVRTVSKFKEAGERLLWLTVEEETAIREALTPDLRPLFAVSVHTGLRWSEQVALRWKDVDMLSGVITVPRAKHGYTRRVPANSLVRGVLVDLGSGRARPDDPEEPVFPVRYTEASKFFPKAVERAQAALREAEKDASRLDGYTWHSNRHTFASRLVMAGADPLTVKELGGWRTLAMVQRYAHLAPSHLAAAVELLVPGNGVEGAGKPAASDAQESAPSAAGRSPEGAVELRRNFDGASARAAGVS